MNNLRVSIDQSTFLKILDSSGSMKRPTELQWRLAVWLLDRSMPVREVGLE